MLRARVVATLLGPLAVVSFTVSACGGGSSATPASSTSTSRAPSTTSTPSTASATSEHCRTDQLRGSLGETDAGAGQRFTPLVLTNTSTAACTLRGFPGVSLVDATGTQLGSAASREGGEGAAVRIAPGATVSATLHTNSAGTSGTCTPASSRLRVYPPDNTVPLEFAAAYTACGMFSVTTLVAGSGGR